MEDIIYILSNGSEVTEEWLNNLAIKRNQSLEELLSANPDIQLKVEEVDVPMDNLSGITQIANDYQDDDIYNYTEERKVESNIYDQLKTEDLESEAEHKESKNKIINDFLENQIKQEGSVYNKINELYQEDTWL